MKVGTRFLITRLVEDIVAHDLNDAQPISPAKSIALRRISWPWRRILRRVAAQRIFAMPAQAHGHDPHAGVGDGAAQCGPPRRPTNPGRDRRSSLSSIEISTKS